MVAIPHIPPFPLQGQLWLDNQTDKMLLIHINKRVHNVLWEDNTGEIPAIIYKKTQVDVPPEDKSRQNDF